MDSEKPQIEELHGLEESLELQRRQALAQILELQDDGAEPAKTEKSRMKLLIVNRELFRLKCQLTKLGGINRMVPKRFASMNKIQSILETLQKSVSLQTVAAVRLREEAEAKVQILKARSDKFEVEKMKKEGEIGELKEEISRVLQAGEDPGKINQKVRIKVQEIEDLDSWIEQLGGAILEAEREISKAKAAHQQEVVRVINEAKALFESEMNDHLAAAAELLDSWPGAVNQIFRDYQFKNPGGHSGVTELASDPDRSLFLCNLTVDGAMGGRFPRPF